MLCAYQESMPWPNCISATCYHSISFNEKKIFISLQAGYKPQQLCTQATPKPQASAGQSTGKGQTL